MILNFGTRYPTELKTFIESPQMSFLPQDLKLQISKTSITESFDQILTIILMQFVMKVSQEDNSQIKEVLIWGMNEALEVNSAQTLFIQWVKKIAEILYDEPVLGEL